MHTRREPADAAACCRTHLAGVGAVAVLRLDGVAVGEAALPQQLAAVVQLHVRGAAQIHQRVVLDHAVHHNLGPAGLAARLSLAGRHPSVQSLVTATAMILCFETARLLPALSS